MTSKEKRKIIVGFLEPSELEKNNIYVILNRKKDDGMAWSYKSGKDYISVINKENRLTKGGEGRYTNGPEKSNNINYNRRIDEFLEELAKCNNAEIVYNIENDGFILKERLSRLQKYLELSEDLPEILKGIEWDI